MPELPPARLLRRRGTWTSAADRLALDYETRLAPPPGGLTTSGGHSVLVDLPDMAGLRPGDALELEDGRLVEIVAADEPVLVISGDLPRLAWHLGNRHIPCQIDAGAGRLVIRPEPGLELMLTGLGAILTRTTAPFAPAGDVEIGIGQYNTGGPDLGPAHRHVHHHSGHRHLSEDDDIPPDAD